jgi:hypothetical protein
MKQNLIFFLIGIFVLSISCQNQKSKKNPVQKNESEVIVEEVIEIIPELRSLSTIKAVFQLWDVGHYPGITNDTDKAVNYKGDRKMAANIGVYLADMLYAMSTSAKPDAYKSYGATMELAKNIGLTKEFPAAIVKRYQDTNVSNDTIVAMLENSLANSEKELSDKNKSEYYVLMLFGNYIEKLYIVSSIIQRPKEANVPEAAVTQLKRNLLFLIQKQSGPLDELVALLADYSDDASHVVVLDEIKELSNRYKEAAAKRETISQLEPAEIYKAKEIVAIHKQIEKVRNRIVN